MKHLLKLSVVLMVLVVGLLCLTGPVQAASTESGSIGKNLTWTLTSDGTLTISGEGKMDFGYSSIPWSGSKKSSIKAVVIESGVTSIDTDAFNGCSNLQSAVIADTVTVIGDSAFSSCTSLTDVTLSENLTDIKQCAFAACSSLTNITLPETLTDIGNSAFKKCTSLASITIPGSVEEIYEYTFRNCTGLTEVVFCEGVSIIGDDTFVDCTGLKNVSFPMSLTKIETGAFANCTGLTDVVIPNGKTSLLTDAFYGCTGLTTVTAPGWCASEVFSKCTNVKSFTVSEGYVADGSSGYAMMFGNFPNIEHISLPSSVTGLHDREFAYLSTLRSIDLPEGLQIIREGAFRDCTALASVTIPSTVTEMENDVFKGCTGLKELIISEGVTDLGSSTFWGCTGLTSVTIPGSLTSLKNDVFRLCTGLTDVTICEGVPGIGYQAFAGCSGLKRISIPNSVTSIGSSAFGYCSSLESVTIPAGVTSVGECAFANCGKLKTVYFEGNAPSFVSDAFYDVTATCYYPAGNSTWTSSVMQDYRGNLTWVAYCKEHELGEWYVAKEPTCTENGKQQRDCKNCDYHEEKVIPATGHTEVIDEAVAPGCTETGLTEGVHCSVCDAVIVAQTVVEATGHNEVVDSVVDPTCTERGYTVYVCTICGETRNGAYTDPLGHDWHGLTCGRCGEVDMPFTDVKEGKHYYKPVIWAVENGITNGTTPTTFEPNAPCTRWQIVTFLWRAAGCPEPVNTEHNFTDVNPKKVYYKAMLWAIENGITNGTTATTFSPNDTCTRWQIVTFLWRYAGCPEPKSTEHNFTDVNPKKVYYKAMLWAVEEGITNGTTATTFAPNDPCTRGQIVTFLYRYLVE